MGEWLAALAWLIAWWCCAGLVFPLLRWAVPEDDFLSLAIAFAAGPALVVLPFWWFALLLGLPFTKQTLVGYLVSFLLANAALLLANRSLQSAWRASVLRLVGTGFVFALAYALYLLFRSYGSAIRYTEKPMELAFLSSVVYGSQIPPADPWFAGEPINYYYFGYLVMGGLAKLLGLPPEIAFNLALASLFSASVVSIGITAGRMARSSSQRLLHPGAALLAPLLLVGIGNWETAWLFLQDPKTTLESSWWTGPGWKASRVIVDGGFSWGGEPRPTINEFPAFSFILGDLHPHVLALPLVLAFVAGVAALQLAGSLRAALLAGAILGILWLTNTWSVPLAALLAVAGLVLTKAQALRRRVLLGALVLVTAVASALPFQLTYVPSYGLPASELPPILAELPLLSWLLRTVGVVAWERSSCGELLRAHGPLLALGTLGTFNAFFNLPSSQRPRLGILAAGASLCALLSFVSQTPALFLFGLPLAVLLVLARNSNSRNSLPYALLAVAWFAIIMVEFLFVRDVFGDRMNTVFKVYFDSWAFQALAISVLLARFPTSRVNRMVIGSVMVSALVLAGLYPPLSVWKWTEGFAFRQGLDGLTFLKNEARAEYQAIRWIRDYVPPNATVLEMPGCSYVTIGPLPLNRVSMATGRPTILGWEGHEYQWRRGSRAYLADLAQRRERLRSFFQQPTTELVRAVVQQYNVQYIYLGEIEREGTGPTCPLVSTPQIEPLVNQLVQLGWREVYANETVVILASPSAEVLR